MKLHKVTSQKALIVAATAMRVSDLSGSLLVQTSSGLQQRNECLPLSKTVQAVIFLLGTGQRLGSNNGRGPGLVPIRPSRQTLAQINKLRPLHYAFQKRTVLRSVLVQRPIIFMLFFLSFFFLYGLCLNLPSLILGLTLILLTWKIW